MNFTVPCDYKMDTIKKICSMSKKYKSNIAEVYGNLPDFMPVGNGRGYIAYNDKLEEFERYVKYAKELGVKFNYTINAACTENQELTYLGQKKIIERMDYLIDIGIEKYTVASISLLQLLHHVYKDKIDITLSTISNVNSVNRAIQAEKIGASVIVLGEDETRNIDLIKNIKKNVKCKLEIIVNSMCLWNCIYRQNHYNSLSHIKNENQTECSFYPNQCYMIKLKNPVERIKSPWIRPEDIHKYEELGIDLFKIIGREINQKADWVRMIEAYCQKKYNGNLIELLYAFSEKPDVYLENKSLDGFVDYFFNNEYKCSNICCTGKCDYCIKFYEKVKRND